MLRLMNHMHRTITRTLLGLALGAVGAVAAAGAYAESHRAPDQP
jgi:ABC-type nitrate/sulfonate/bicarbonate transport system permease component